MFKLMNYLSLASKGSNLIMLIKKVRGVLFNPKEFFEKVRREEGIVAFKYNLILGLINPSLMLLFMIASEFYSRFDAFSRAIVYYSLTLLSPFLFAGILHLLVKIFRGKGAYSETYKAVVYSQTPRFILDWVGFLPYEWIVNVLPILTGSISVWFYQVIGLSKLHDLSMLRVVLLILISVPFFLMLYFLTEFYYLIIFP